MNDEKASPDLIMPINLPIHDLMDRKLEPELYADVRRVAEAVPLVLAIEKLALRRTGLNVFAEIHVQADPNLPLSEAQKNSGPHETG